MSFDWQRWIDKFVAYPGYNNTEAKISEVIEPVYEVIGAHRLTSAEDNARQLIYVDVLDASNKREAYAEIEYNSGVSDPLLALIDRPLDEITYFPFPGEGNVNIWCPGGECVVGLKPGYSYFVVFREVVKPDLQSLGGIQVTVNQKWVASLRPDQQGNITFFVDIINE
jgi:hypothetical protein